MFFFVSVFGLGTMVYNGMEFTLLPGPHGNQSHSADDIHIQSDVLRIYECKGKLYSVALIVEHPIWKKQVTKLSCTVCSNC